VATVEPAIRPEIPPGIHDVEAFPEAQGITSENEHLEYSAMYDQPAPRIDTFATL
jgi:hypothetical protein